MKNITTARVQNCHDIFYSSIAGQVNEVGGRLFVWWTARASSTNTRWWGWWPWEDCSRRGCAGPAEDRRRQGQRPMIAKILSDLFLFTFTFLWGSFHTSFYESVLAWQRTEGVWNSCLCGRLHANKLVTCVLLTLFRAGPSAVSKVRGGHICPPRFWRVLGGFGLNFLLEPHILPRMTPIKRIYNFQIPRTSPTDGLKKVTFSGGLSGS